MGKESGAEGGESGGSGGGGVVSSRADVGVSAETAGRCKCKRTPSTSDGRRSSFGAGVVGGAGGGRGGGNGGGDGGDGGAGSIGVGGGAHRLK